MDSENPSKTTASERATYSENFGKTSRIPLRVYLLRRKSAPDPLSDTALRTRVQGRQQNHDNAAVNERGVYTRRRRLERIELARRRRRLSCRTPRPVAPPDPNVAALRVWRRGASTRRHRTLFIYVAYSARTYHRMCASITCCTHVQISIRTHTIFTYTHTHLSV